MRIRLALSPPFNQQKILLPIPQSQDVTTVSSLKKYIFRSLSSVSTVAGSWKEIKLEIDGFELLSGSAVTDVVQESDVIQVGLKAECSSRGSEVEPRDRGKRRAVSSSAVDRERHGKKPRTEQKRLASLALPTEPAVVTNRDSAPARPSPSPTSSSSSSAISSSSVSSSSSSKTSSSTSSLTSSSGSSSSSSSSSPEDANPPAAVPLPMASTASGQPTFPVLTNGSSTARHVPPGQGKPETRNRNARRRQARKFRREVDESSAGPAREAAPVVSRIVNAGAPEVASGPGQPVGTENGEDTTPLRNANRNKRKGFYKEMRHLKGTRTVFEDGDAEPSIPAPAGSRVDNSPEDMDLDLDSDAGEAAQPPTGLSSSGLNGTVAPHLAETTGPTYAEGEEGPGPSTAYHWQYGFVPPSQLETLPSNVFVTSMVFNAPRRRRGGQVDHVEYDQSYEAFEKMEGVPAGEEQWTGGHGVDAQIPEAAVESQHQEVYYEERPLTYNESMIETAYEAVEASYDDLEAISKHTSLDDITHSILAWRVLELDLTTYSPQLKLKLARALKVSVTSWTEPLIRLKRFKRYDEVHEHDHDDENDNEEQGGGDSEPGVIEVSISDLIQGGYKIVKDVELPPPSP